MPAAEKLGLIIFYILDGSQTVAQEKKDSEHYLGTTIS